MKTFVGITGTTSVGKSEVAVQLAKKMHTEIISADSMQIYKGMDIGTAKIRPDQMQGVKHHLLSIVEPNCDFSSFLYREQAAKLIDSMDSVPIVVGGTGFYFDSIVYPPEFGESSKERREELSAIYAQQGLKPLQERLLQIDPNAYRTVDVQNPKRLIRAIEIAESGGSRAKGKGTSEPQYKIILFVLQRSRQELYAQIEKRVEKMIEDGLVEEVRALVEKYGICKTPAFSAIGYKEIVNCLQGNITLQQAVAQIKLNTRHYAKRQISYFKRMNVAEYVDVDGKSVDEIAEEIYSALKKYDITT